jgi:hypothetical protein
MIAGLQFRPQNVFPSNGMLQISIQGNPFTVSDPLTVTCHGMHNHNVTLSTLTVNITSVSVHRSGALNLTGDWIPLTNSPKTINILQLTSLTQLGSTSVKEGTIDIIRIDVTPIATASSDSGPISLVVSSSHLQVEPNAQVNGGMTTNISIAVTPHIVCEGNNVFRLTPELSTTSTSSED